MGDLHGRHEWGCTDGGSAAYAQVPAATPHAMHTLLTASSCGCPNTEPIAHQAILLQCAETDAIAVTPLCRLTMRIRRSLPDAPAQDELPTVLSACPATLEAYGI